MSRIILKCLPIKNKSVLLQYISIQYNVFVVWGVRVCCCGMSVYSHA